MRRLLTLIYAVLGAAMLLGLFAGGASGANVQCGDVITQDTTLDADLSCSAEPALAIGADDVTLDLGGHTIWLEGEGNDTAITGSPFNRPSGNVTIENGVLDRGGIYLLNNYRPIVRHLVLTGGAGIGVAVSQEAVIEDNEILGGQGIDLEVGDGEIRHNTMKNGVSGIVIGQGARALITDNLISGNEVGISSFRGGGRIAHNRILDNTYSGISFVVAGGDAHDNVISGNGVGVMLYETNGLLLRRNVISHNSGGGITMGWEASLDARDNVISHNGGNGVLVDGFSSSHPATAQLTGNTISANALDGVHVGEFTFTRLGTNWRPPPLLDGNRTDRNGDDGIDTVNPDTTLTRNHSWFNGDLGIEAVPGTLGGGNWAKHNSNPKQCVPGSLCSTTGKPR